MGRPIMPQTSHRLGVAALLLALAVPAGSARAQEARMVPVTVDGEHARLEMRVYEAASGAPAPTLVFNHGSTGLGTNPASFTRPLDFPEVARFFVARGLGSRDSGPPWARRLRGTVRRGLLAQSGARLRVR